MSDIAQLGFAINSKPVADAAANLDRMEAAGKRAQSGVDKIIAAVNRQTMEIQKLTSGLGGASSMTERVTQANVRAAEAMRRTNEQALRTGGIFGSAANAVKGFIGAWASFKGIQTLQQMADTWSDLTSRVRLSIGANNNAADVMDRLSIIARQTYSSFELTADSFTRNATTLNALGKSTQLQLDYTQALNNALVVSGAKGQQAELVQNALARAMAEGALKGDDLNLILNYGSRVAAALAEELGVNVTQLRSLAKEGKITGGVIFDSLVNSMEAVTREAESMPATIGDAFVLIRNSVLKTVGVFDQQNKLSETFATRLITLADNMGAIVGTAAALGAVLAGVWSAKLLAQAIAFTTSLIAQGVQYARNATLATAWAAAHAGGVAASIKSVGALNIALGGLAAGFAGWQIGQWLRENFLEAELAGIAFVEGSLVGWERLKQGAQVAFQGILLVWNTVVDAMATAFAATLSLIGEGMENLPDWAGGQAGVDLQMWAAGFVPATTAAVEFADAVDRINTEADANVAKIREITGDMADLAIAESRAAESAAGTAAAVEQVTLATEESAESKRRAAQLARELEQATQAANTAYMGYLQQLDPVLAMELEHVAALAQIEEWHRIGAISVERYGQMKAQAAQLNARAVAAMDRERDILGRLNDDYAEQVKMLGMTRRELAGYQAGARAVAEAQRILGAELEKMPGYLEKIERTARENEEALFDMDTAAGSLEEILSRFDDIGFGKLVSEIQEVQRALEQATDPDTIVRMERALGRLRQQGLESMVGASQEVLRGMQGMAKEGSSAYKALELAQHALNLSMAIGGIVNQANGDPYTAWARMAAMAVTMASYVGQNFGGSSGFSDAAGQRQATQGTGSVLGDPEAKSESVARAIEITADATTALVGINRGMLRALVNLQDAIGAATGMLARGAGDGDFSGMGLSEAGDFRGLFGRAPRMLVDPLNLLGGSSKITDQGIVIFGGALLDILDDITVGAYQQVESRRWRFGSRRTNEGMTDVSDEFGRQFELIISSIVDTVREGALALGLLPADIEAALAAFELEEIRISLMDLTPEEAQAELEAVFGEIFDGLAGSVVPWIEQFQQVGEGLGETLVRVATGVQVMQEAIKQLGFTMEGKPEQFAQFSEELIGLMGGIEGMVEGMSAFMGAFATDEHRFAVASEALASAFAEVGLAIPGTRDGMWELMQSLDGTTEQGREQIATLLRLAGVADQYYTMLERGGAAMVDQMTQLGDIMGIVDQALREAAGGSLIDWQEEQANLEAANRRLIATAIEQGASEDELARIRRFGQLRLEELAAAEEQARQGYSRLLGELQRDGWSQPIQGLMRLYDEYQQQVEALHAAARAAGRTGASTWALAAAQAAYERQVRRFAAQLLQAAQGLLGQLGYAGYEDFAGANGADLGGINDVTQAVEDRYATEMALLEQLDAFVRGLGISALSPLTPREQLQESEAEYMRLLALAQAGDMDALAQLQAAASNYLGQAQSYYGGVGPYQEIFELVRGQLGALVEAGPRSEQIGPNTPVYGGPVTVEPGEAWGQMNAMERALLTQQLVDHIAALSLATRTPILQLLEDLNIPLTQLVTDLGINLEQISGAAVEALAQLAYDLGLPLGELVQALGLELPDLADGVRDLAEELGINLSELTAATAFQLADLARGLNVDLAELTTALGIDLGRLTDVNSPIYQALAQTIGTLPDEQAAALREYLEAIAQSPDGQSAAANIAAMEDYINTLDADIALALAPFFGGVNPPGALTELDYLGWIDDSLESLLGLIDGETGTNGILTRIESAIGAANTAGDIPGYAAGGMVGGPTLAWVGERGRELVLPNSVTEFFARNGIPVNTGGGDAMVFEMRAMRRELYELKQQQAEASRREEQHLSRISDGTDRSARANERAADVMGARS